MPIHRVAFRDSADIVKAGSSPNSTGIGGVRAAVPNRGATSGNLVQISHDGASVVSLADGHWGSKTIANGAAASLFSVAVAPLGMSGGDIQFLVEASDGTDMQALSGWVSYSCVNKAGAFTGTVVDTAAADAKAVSASTLTLAWTIVAGTGVMIVKLQPTTGLTITTTPFRVTFYVSPIQGAITLL